ncbi:ABC transporter ATP-binding protein/permease [bacterium]|nr:ABC transporter ATP-binding protein/permease [bacterium]
MNSLRHLLPYLKPYRTAIIFGSVSALISSGIGALGPWLLKLAIDSIQAGNASHELLKYALLIVGVALVAGFFRFLMRWILIGMSREVELDLRNRVFKHLQSLSASFYNKHRTGDLMARMTNDLESVRSILGPGIMYPIDTFGLAVFSIIMMIIVSPKLTLYVLLMTPVVSVSVFYLGRLTHKLYTRIQEQYSALSDAAQENISGARIVRAFAQEEREIRKFDMLNREYVIRNVAMVKMQALFMPLMFLFFEIGAAIILYLGGRGIIQGVMSLGDFVAFVGYLGMLEWPMIAIGWVANLIQRGAASMKRINEIMKVPPEIAQPERSRMPQEIRGEIVFKSVSFGYEKSEILREINLHIKPGQTVAIVGRTGSGKTTLVNLLTRLFDPTFGTVLIDGIPTTEWDLEKLRAEIGMVPQDAFLFSTTVERNIAFGRGNARREEVEKVSGIAQIDKDVADFVNGYETRVGERGLTLSGGQKGRVTLARALIRDPRILILDDALAAVDTHTEEEILNRLRDFMKGRTSIVISHRVSTVKHADRIYVLEGGKIVEQGKHDELLKQGGYYAELERRQRLEEELEREA